MDIEYSTYSLPLYKYRHMVQEARRYKLSVGFLDPILVTLDAIKQNEGFVLEYVTRAWLAQKEKDAILFFYNPG